MTDRDYREPADKVRENRCRRWAARLGFTLYRSRAKRLHRENQGLYQLVDFNNLVAEGRDWESDLAEIEEFLQREEGRLRRRP